MKTHHFLFGLTLLAGMMVATPTHAYFTTSQSARTFNATSTLFIISYSFGIADRDLDLPVAAVRDEITALPHTLGYTLLDSKGSTTGVGTMWGVVLSKASIIGDQYHIKAGETASFMFVTLLTTPPAGTETPYQVRVTALPFSFTKSGVTYQNGLTPSELQYYTTPLSLTKPGKIGNAVIGKGIRISYTSN